MAAATKPASKKPAAKPAKTEAAPKKTRTFLTPAQKLAKLDEERAALEAQVAAGEEKRTALTQSKDDAKASVLSLIDVVDGGDLDEAKNLRAAVNQFIASHKELAKLG